jgi:beta-N-acetylhexosaminidase
MTAHIVYQDIDPQNPATHSPKVIGDVIRGYMGFDGLLISDDLSMEALTGSLSERAEKSFTAGCDVVLHCNGKFDEMQTIAAVAGSINRGW